MAKSNVIRVSAEAKKLLWYYKIDNDCRSFSAAIAKAIREAKNADE